MTEEYALERYEEACALLPGRLRTAAMAEERGRRAGAEELRLRIGRPMYLTLPEGEVPLPQTRIVRGDLEQVLDRATEFSRYAASETLRRGYVTAQGGFRIGVCGTALPAGEDNQGLRDVSSLAIRIPRVREGTARPVLPDILEEGRPLSTLVLSPPGGGKTTLLRDLVRLLSQGTELSAPRRVALVEAPAGGGVPHGHPGRLSQGPGGAHAPAGHDAGDHRPGRGGPPGGRGGGLRRRRVRSRTAGHRPRRLRPGSGGAACGARAPGMRRVPAGGPHRGPGPGAPEPGGASAMKWLGAVLVLWGALEGFLLRRREALTPLKVGQALAEDLEVLRCEVCLCRAPLPEILEHTLAEGEGARYLWGGERLAEAIEETREELTRFLRAERERQAAEGRVTAALCLSGASLLILVLI